MINFLIVDKIIKDALIEDIPNEDITTNSIPSLWIFVPNETIFFNKSKILLSSSLNSILSASINKLGDNEYLLFTIIRFNNSYMFTISSPKC